MKRRRDDRVELAALEYVSFVGLGLLLPSSKRTAGPTYSGIHPY